MSQTAEKMLVEINALSREDREMLLQYLIHSLDEPDESPEQAAFDAELDRRNKEIEQGIVGVPADDVFKRIRDKYL